jgi:poly(3-hydroxybutyrate) depolymerase
MVSAFNAMRQGASINAASAGEAKAGSRIMPTIVFHADGDTTVNPRNGDQVIAQAGGAVGLRTEEHSGRVQGGHGYRRTVYRDSKGAIVLEQWLILGGGHAWSGGSADGSFTDPRGPDASREMLRFFRECGRATR